MWKEPAKVFGGLATNKEAACWKHAVCETPRTVGTEQRLYISWYFQNDKISAFGPITEISLSVLLKFNKGKKVGAIVDLLIFLSTKLWISVLGTIIIPEYLTHEWNVK